MTNTAALRQNLDALTKLRFEDAGIVGGRVTNPEAAAALLLAVRPLVNQLLMRDQRTPQEPREAKPIRAPHAVPTVKPNRTPAPVDVATLTDAQLFKYYQKIAPVEDLKFLLTHSSNGLHEQGDRLLQAGDPGAIKRALPNLRARWRESKRPAPVKPNLREWAPENKAAYVVFCRVARAWNAGRS